MTHSAKKLASKCNVGLPSWAVSSKRPEHCSRRQRLAWPGLASDLPQSRQMRPPGLEWTSFYSSASHSFGNGLSLSLSGTRRGVHLRGSSQQVNTLHTIRRRHSWPVERIQFRRMDSQLRTRPKRRRKTNRSTSSAKPASTNSRALLKVRSLASPTGPATNNQSSRLSQNPPEPLPALLRHHRPTRQLELHRSAQPLCRLLQFVRQKLPWHELGRRRTRT